MRTPRPARFLFGKEAFFILARKSRGYTEAYIGIASRVGGRAVEILPVPPASRSVEISGGGLTAPGRKRTISGWKLSQGGEQ